MSRRSKRSDPKSPEQSERRRPARRPLPPLPEVVLARRPASAPAPAQERQAERPPLAVPVEAEVEKASVPPRRPARIVSSPSVDVSELERRQLLTRLLESEGSVAITRAAKAYRKGGFDFPNEQLVQLTLLEHSDEDEVRSALDVLSALLDEEPPIKLPVFEQRLKRLEEAAENPETRACAAELRRALRS